MKDSANRHRERSRGSALIARVFGLFFLVGFMINAVQLIVYGVAPLIGGLDAAMAPPHLGLTAAAAILNLALALMLLRGPRRPSP